MADKIHPVLRQNLLNLARAFAQGEDIPLRIVSQRAYGDSRFFGLLAKNSNRFTVEKYDQLVEWFTGHWPDGIAMPVLIDPKHKQVKPNGKKTTSIRDRGEGRKGKQGGSKKVSAKGGEEGGSKEA